MPISRLFARVLLRADSCDESPARSDWQDAENLETAFGGELRNRQHVSRFIAAALADSAQGSMERWPPKVRAVRGSQSRRGRRQGLRHGRCVRLRRLRLQWTASAGQVPHLRCAPPASPSSRTVWYDSQARWRDEPGLCCLGDAMTASMGSNTSPRSTRHHEHPLSSSTVAAERSAPTSSNTARYTPRRAGSSTTRSKSRPRRRPSRARRWTSAA